MNASVRTALWLGLVLVLAACSSSSGDDGPSQGTMTPDEMNAVVDDYTADGQAMHAEAEASVAAQAIGAMPSLPADVAGAVSASPSTEALGLLLPLADRTLPRMQYEWDASASAWVESPSENLVLLWSYDDASATPHDARVEVDWDAGAATREVAADVSGSPTVEAPRAVHATLEVDGERLGEFDAGAAWHDTSTCGAILQPTSLSLDGALGDDAAKVTFQDLTASMTDAGSIDTSGDVVATAGADTMSFGWDVSLAGTWITDAEDCFWTDYQASSGSVALSVAGSEHAATFAFDFSNVETGDNASVDVSDGRLTLDGRTALTFQGTLDQPAGDDVPGANLQLEFDGETMTLKEYLEGDLGLTRVTLGALSALRLAF